MHKYRILLVQFCCCLNIKRQLQCAMKCRHSKLKNTQLIWGLRDTDVVASKTSRRWLDEVVPIPPSYIRTLHISR